MRMRLPNGEHKTTCSNCGRQLEANRIDKYRYCLTCHASYIRRTRKRHIDLSEEQRKRANARAYLHEYIKKGKIGKGVCSICGSDEKIEAHHEDYNKPLEVKWYCRKHHVELTTRERQYARE